jgi:hypothetical protein
MSGTVTTSTSTVFTPTSNQAFSFGATFDGSPFVVVITWNLTAQRWYFTVFTQQNVVIVCKALVASPDNFPINLLFGYFFTSTMVFFDSDQTFVVSP